MLQLEPSQQTLWGMINVNLGLNYLDSMKSIFDQSSDYHDNVDKYSYIFQSPNVFPRQNQLQQF